MWNRQFARNRFGWNVIRIADGRMRIRNDRIDFLAFSLSLRTSIYEGFYIVRWMAFRVAVASWVATRHKEKNKETGRKKISRNKSPTLIKWYTMAHKFKSILSWFFFSCRCAARRECGERKESELICTVQTSSTMRTAADGTRLPRVFVFGTKNEIWYADVAVCRYAGVWRAHANVFTAQIELWPLEQAKRLLFGCTWNLCRCLELANRHSSRLHYYILLSVGHEPPLMASRPCTRTAVLTHCFRLPTADSIRCDSLRSRNSPALNAIRVPTADGNLSLIFRRFFPHVTVLLPDWSTAMWW